MKTVTRLEEAEVIKYDENDDGFLTVELAATRTGVMPYLDAETGDVVMELKPPDEIFSDVTMNSLKGVPVTNEHPPILLNSENWFDFTKGTTHLDVKREDNKLIVSETLFDDELIAYVKSGKKVEVSIGFRCDIDESPGTFQGKEYDRVQRNIRINHVAHTKAGRAGEEVRARVDSKVGFSHDYDVRQDGYTPKNPSNYGTTEVPWNDITPQIPNLTDLSDSEKRQYVQLYAWASTTDMGGITNKTTDIKLPHHEMDGSVSWNGIVGAMAALNGARGGVDIPDGDRRAVYNHLVNHYKNDFDAEPPEFGDSEMEINLKKEDEKMSDEMVSYKFDDGTEIEVPEDVVEKLDDLDLEEETVEIEEVELGDNVIHVKADEVEVVENFMDSLEEKQAKIDSKESEIKALEGRIDDLEKQDVEKIVQDRLDLIDTVRKYDKDFDASGLKEKDIKVEFIQKVDEDFDPEGKADAYIDARFDGALNTMEKIKSASHGDNSLKFKKQDSQTKTKLDEKKAKRKNLKK